MSKREYSKKVAKKIGTVLKSEGLKHYYDEEMGVIRLGITLGKNIGKLDYLIIVSKWQYTVYTTFHVNADPKENGTIQKLQEFICRANCGLRNGNFELDLEKGEIRYKVFVGCNKGVVPSENLVKESILCSVAMYDRYASGILRILYGEYSAKEAIEQCEGMKVELESETEE